MSYLKKSLILIVILLMSGCKGSNGGGNSNSPVANAGQNQTASVGNSVTLNGSKSYDPNGYALTYWWTIKQKPVGSNATLSLTNPSQPTFLVDLIGKYGISLTVSSQGGVSASSTVSVTGIASSATWHHLTGIPSDRQIYCLAIDPVNTNTLYAGSGFSDGIYKTTDGGSTWVTTSTGLYLTSSTDIVTILEV
ncbi:MAG: PKD domain-containing protein, partial [Deltaproteobacteria bacterium]|nr:PKD domain-containing protein [Deltaproteobacteria bacterium]